MTRSRNLTARLRGIAGRLRDRLSSKGANEMRYWRKQFRAQNGKLSNDHFEAVFTRPFDLSAEDYTGMTILDIGCGPRGSLEWASAAARRVGLDPLADEYRSLGTDAHAMEYVCSGSESMPFDDATFDITTCLNALDHVDDFDATLDEMKRVTKPGGWLLVATEIDHTPTPAEPISINDEMLARFAPEFEVQTEFRVGTPDDHNLHRAALTREPEYRKGEAGYYVARMLRR